MNISFFYMMEIATARLKSNFGEEIKDVNAYFRDIFSGEYRYTLILKSSETAILKVSVE